MMIGNPVVAVPDGADPYEYMLRHIEAEVHEAGWDQGNTIALVDAPQPFGAAVPVQMHGLHVAVPSLPLAVRRQHPIPMLEAFVGQWGKGLFELAPNFYAAVLTVEAWSVGIRCADASAVEQAWDDADKRRIYTRDDKREMRMALVVTVTGEERLLNRVRDHEPELVDMGRMGGDVVVAVAALRAFVQTIRILTLVRKSRTERGA